MDGRSVGKIIEDKRKELNLTIEQCSSETRISKKFLKSIEDDNFDAFPGEVYYLGFLRTYSQLLQLDANELVKLYYRQKKIEEPAPLEELTKPIKKEIKLPKLSKNAISIMVIAVIAVVLIVGIILIVSIPSKQKSVTDSRQLDKEQKPELKKNEFLIEQRRTIRTFRPGDVILIPDGSNYHRLKIITVDPKNKVTQLSFEEIASTLELKEKDKIDIDYDINGETDFQIVLNELDSSGVSLTFERLTSEYSRNGFTTDNLSISSSSVAQTDSGNSSLTMPPLVVVVNASKKGYIRLESDIEGTIEQMLAPSQSVKISGKEKIVMMLTNSSGMSVMINNSPLVLPKEFTIYCVISWIFDKEKNSYSLVTEFKK
ncbi:MAG TPA: helix-turn-helix domain-containing protein [Exilispira sp.]|nr:helix-turn-helix domain-containing protein [Exilispira sp.]